MNETKIFYFSYDCSEAQSANLMKIVEQHISSKQALARASLENSQRQPSQPAFSNLDLQDTTAYAVDYQNPFEALNTGKTYMSP